MSTRSSNIQRKCRPTLLPRKSAQQKRNRRKLGLMKKASEYSELCDAEVCVGIRFRESGRVFTFVSDPNGFWSKLDSLLEAYYPPPVRETGKIFRSRSRILDSNDHVPAALPRSTISGDKSSLIDRSEDCIIPELFIPG
ncbi:hypothetical protein KXX05_000439, partial [Aspergillus fumigatus]